MKKFLALICIVSISILMISCPVDTEETDTPSVLDAYVSSKYSTGTTASRAAQTNWKAANCHDPKIFQDDDGKYYVYATDASCGNIGRVGLHIRYSDDLINWTGVFNSALQGYWAEDYVAWECFKASSSQVLQNNSSYTAYTWAPTVIKKNDLYYMYHGVNSTFAKISGTTTAKAVSSITLAIASSPMGPFYPASFISSYNAETGNDLKEADIVAIQNKLSALGVAYEQNFLVRFVAGGGASSTTIPSVTPSIDGTAVAEADFTKTANSRFGCIDPEFVMDIATGEIKTYTIGSNECYAMIYGSWMYGISLIYVDTDSLKQVATIAFSDGTTSYEVGDELDIPLDEANYYYVTENSKDASTYGLLGERIAGGYGAGYEGAQLFYNGDTGYYYLITSCGGLDYEYRCTLGRSQNIKGPYIDAGGKDMLLTNASGDSNYSGNYHAVGSKIIGSYALSGEYSFRCQGGLSVIRNAAGKVIFACHTRTNFQEGYYFYLQCHQMFFNEEGWPVLNQNEYYDDYEEITADGTERLCSISKNDIAGTYDTILTVRGTETAAVSTLGIYGALSVTSTVNKLDAVPTASKAVTLNADGSIGGSYKGTWTLAEDGYSVTINLTNTSGTALGTFKGYVLHAVDWARKGDVERRTITFTTLCYDEDGSSTESGEFFWGNKR